MNYGELYVEPAWTGHNKQNGRFLKGHVPFNKGKKWSEFKSKRSQRRSMKGWKNLNKFRPTTRPDTAGRCRKKVVAVMDDGSFKVFPYTGSAAQWLGGDRSNVSRCCRFNGHGTKNTDHRYKGARLYYEIDAVWMKKIKQ